MAFDGVMMRAVRQELSARLTGARIDRIYQPSRHEIVIIARQAGEALRLLISAAAETPRIHITGVAKENPESPPAFCMLLRKHLVDGRIDRVEQVGLDRILRISVREPDYYPDYYSDNNYNDYDGDSHGDDQLRAAGGPATRARTRTLVVEIMGKHSNIILLNGDGTTIMDSIKHVTRAMSRYREVLPGRPYSPPPAGDKRDLLGETRESLARLVEESFSTETAGVSVSRWVMNTFIGFGPTLAREIVERAGLDPDAPVRAAVAAAPDAEAPDAGTRAGTGAGAVERIAGRLAASLSDMAEIIKEGRFTRPTVVEDSGTGRILAFAPFPLIQRPNPGDEAAGPPAEAVAREFASISEMLDYVYTPRDIQISLAEAKSRLVRVIEGNLSRARRKLDRQEEALCDAENAESYKLMGELIKANMGVLKKGDTEARVINYFDPELKPVKIELDPALAPSENAQAYFAKYAKAKRSLEVTREQRDRTKSDIEYLEQVALTLEQAQSLDAVDEIREELIASGYAEGLPDGVQDGRRARQDGHARDVRARNRSRRAGPVAAANRPRPMRFKSEDGYEILVGRNNRENDFLTMRQAAPDDIWLHAKGIPGAHVIIRADDKGNVSERALLDAAGLAAYFSKGRQSTNVDIDYTRRRYVRKPRGAKPGMVIYERQQTLAVPPRLMPSAPDHDNG
ncbi:MAG: fibronectin/fibrinogen-binding protein [Firmicutes bacterium]|nr:fibronectin/fibrinogen-binding protein [Bacillota bacterium]